MKGRFWLQDVEGNILNDSSSEKIDDIFKPLISDVVEALLADGRHAIHSIYLTGSVSRGLAIRGVSDLDLFAVLKKEESQEEPSMTPIKAQEFLSKYPYVSDIQIELWPWYSVFPKDEKRFSIGAFIIKTHAVCIYGRSLEPEIRNFVPMAAIANDDIVQIKSDIEETLGELALDHSTSNVRYWCKRIMKNIIRTGFSLVMDKENGYTRDLDYCCSSFCKYYPNQGNSMKEALALVSNPTASNTKLCAFLCDFGEWIVEASENWLEQYNPRRELSLRIM